MNYLKIDKNDYVNGKGLCVSLFVSGCPHHCKGCFNPESWDYNAGTEFSEKAVQEILMAIEDHGIKRNFSILGGEPLAPSNRRKVGYIVTKVREQYPDITIFLWTGYKYEDLLAEDNYLVNYILKKIDVLIDGPFIEEEKDLTLDLRGSRNQKIRVLGKAEGYELI